MPHIVDAMLDEADSAIAAMRAAALRARTLHARAELMRHMRTTAAANVGRPGAAARIADEWMRAWGLGADAYPGLAAPIHAFTEAFRADAEAAAGADAELRTALAALETALTEAGTSLADQMAFRSECAHGWWELVVPVPPALQRASRQVPEWQPGMAFWEAGCPTHCAGGR